MGWNLYLVKQERVDVRSNRSCGHTNIHPSRNGGGIHTWLLAAGGCFIEVRSRIFGNFVLVAGAVQPSRPLARTCSPRAGSPAVKSALPIAMSRDTSVARPDTDRA